jgi:hypothetical protein
MPTEDRRADRLNWIPVSLSEYHLACRHFPLAMRIEKQLPELGLLVHPRYLINPPLDASGKWRGVYRPIGLRCFPFEADQLSGDPLSDITIAEGSSYLSSCDGIPFLDESGQPGKLITELHRLIGLLRQSRDIFADVLDQYLIAGLLVRLIDSSPADAGSALYVIDHNRLAQMSNAALSAMARHKFLSVDLAVAWAFSLHNLQKRYLPKDPERSRFQLQPASASPMLVPDSTPIDDLVLDDGELVSFAGITTPPAEGAQSF